MITKAQIDEIVRRIVEYCHPERIILFGSYASGTANDDSDLDLAVVWDTDLPKHERTIAVRQAIRAKGKKWFFPMDILVYTPEEMEEWKENPYHLIHEIILTGKTIYESTKSSRLVYQS